MRTPANRLKKFAYTLKKEEILCVHPLKRTGLEAILWKCANILRTKEKSDNRKAVLGLVYLKFVGDKFSKRQEEIRSLPDFDEMYLDMPQFYLSENVFY